MNKLLKIFLTVLLVIITTTAFAQEAAVVEKSQIAEGVTLKHSYTPGEMGSFDTLIINVDGKDVEIFNSEGRKIKEVIPVDGDSDGKLEYIVSMDCGGSGGFYDVVLIKAKGDVWTVAWEDSFANPKLQLNKDNNTVFLVIEHIVIENDTPTKKVTKISLS